MNSTDKFKERILLFLENKASIDGLFSSNFKKDTKNIDDCIVFILNAVQKAGRVGFDDDEIYGLAIHYYIEDEIEIGKMIDNCKIIMNQRIELTEEEKAEAKEAAYKQCIQEEFRKLHRTSEKPKKNEAEVFTQTTLF